MSESDGREDPGEVDRVIAEIRSRLQDGGPEVDHGVLFAYIDGDLPETDKHEVEKRIATWKVWHDAYWRLRADLGAHDQDEEMVKKRSRNEEAIHRASPSSKEKVSKASTQETASSAAAADRQKHEVDEQRSWETYLSWLFGMVIVQIGRDLPGDGEQGRLMEILRRLRVWIATGGGPRFTDENDLWHCLLDIALSEHRRSSNLPRTTDSSDPEHSATVETERDPKVKDYPDTPAFAQIVANHLRRCITLLDEQEPVVREIALGQLAGQGEEELARTVNRPASIITRRLRGIRDRWQPDSPVEETLS